MSEFHYTQVSILSDFLCWKTLMLKLSLELNLHYLKIPLMLAFYYTRIHAMLELPLHQNFHYARIFITF